MTANKKNIFVSVAKLWPFIEKSKKIKIYIYAFLTILSAFADLLSIGAVIPFIVVFTEPENLYNIELLKYLFNSFQINEISEIQLFLFLFFSFAVILAGIIKISLNWYQSRLSYDVAADLGNMVFSSAVSQPFEYHLRKNSSEIVSTVANKANIVADNIIHPLLSFLLAIITFIAIATFLLFINALITSVIFLSIFIIYVIIVIITKKHIQKASLEINRNFDVIMKTLKETFEGIRYVLLTSSQKVFIKTHMKSEKSLRSSQADISFASVFPRSVIESIALLIFAVVVYFFIEPDKGSFEFISFMGAIAMGISRLLPVIQQAYFGWTKLSGARAVIDDTLDYLKDFKNEEVLKTQNINLEKLDFKKCIELKDINFKYDVNSKNHILKNVNLVIPRANKIGITGISGSGKSTLIDLIMGFLKPTSGTIFVDDIQLSKNLIDRWQKNISLVPQNIFLSDSSIASNIAFGIKEENIDLKKVEELIKITQLTEFVNNLGSGIHYIVGEDGKNISYGQKQRIAIARALYRDSDLLVIDEGTSALDKFTQSEIIKALNNLENKPTIIMIAHRIEILDDFDNIYEVIDGTLKDYK